MFYEKLKTICDEKGVKVTPLVLECGGTKGMLSGWKKGASPSVEIVAKIAIRLNISTDLLILEDSLEHAKVSNTPSSDRSINFSENTKFTKSSVYNITGNDVELSPTAPEALENEYKQFSNIIEHIQSLSERERWKAIFRLEDILKEEYPVETVKKNR